MPALSNPSSANGVIPVTEGSPVLLSARELAQLVKVTTDEIKRIQSSELLRDIQSTLGPDERVPLSEDRDSFYAELYVTDTGLVQRYHYAGDSRMESGFRKFNGRPAARALVFDGGGVETLNARLMDLRSSRATDGSVKDGVRTTCDSPEKQQAPSHSSLNFSLSSREFIDITTVKATLEKLQGRLAGVDALFLRIGDEVLYPPVVPRSSWGILNDKAYQRAVSDSIGEVKQPRWVSPNVANGSFEFVDVPVAPILKLLDQRDLLAQMTERGLNRIILGPLTFTASNGKLSITAESLSPRKGTQSVPLHDFDKIDPRASILLTKREATVQGEHFVAKALDLGPSVYFKPCHSCQGDGVFRVEANDNESYRIVTDSFSAGQQLIQAHDQLEMNVISRWKRTLFTVSGHASELLNSTTAAITRKHYFPRSGLELVLDSKEACVALLTNSSLDDYLAEEAIPIEQLDGRMAEFRFVFAAEGSFSERHRLVGHYAKVSGAAVTGNLAGGGYGMETSRVIEKLVYNRGGSEAQSQETYARFVTSAEQYLAKFKQMIRQFNGQRYAVDGAIDNSLRRISSALNSIAVDIVPVWNADTNQLEPYLMETGAPGVQSASMIGVSGLKNANRELYNYAKRRS